MTFASYISVSVVGSAGRKDDGDKMTAQLFNNAVDKTVQIITEDLGLKLSRVCLVSGGAAWTDHIAVDLFLRKLVPALTLYLPAKWVIQKNSPRYKDTGKRSNPGKTSNELHEQFSKKIKRKTLVEIQQAIDAGANIKTHDGFYERNKYVAKSDKLIAFSWSDSDRPLSGGTLHTWRHCKGQRIHVPYSIVVGKSKISQSFGTRDKELRFIKGSKKRKMCNQSHDGGSLLRYFATNASRPRKIMTKPSSISRNYIASAEEAPQLPLINEEDKCISKELDGFDVFGSDGELVGTPATTKDDSCDHDISVVMESSPNTSIDET